MIDMCSEVDKTVTNRSFHLVYRSDETDIDVPFVNMCSCTLRLQTTTNDTSSGTSGNLTVSTHDIRLIRYIVTALPPPPPFSPNRSWHVRFLEFNASLKTNTHIYLITSILYNLLFVYEIRSGNVILLIKYSLKSMSSFHRSLFQIDSLSKVIYF